MNTALEKLKAKHKKEIEEFERKCALLGKIPTDMVNPLIVYNGGPYFGTNGTLIFKGTKEQLYQVVLAFEKEWEIIKPSQVKYGHYRISEFPSLEPPKERNGVELKNSQEIFPVFVRLSMGQGYSSSRAEFYAKNSDGEVYNVELNHPTKLSLSAKTKQYFGDWHYVSGTGQVHGVNEIPKLTKSAYVSTNKSVDGIVHFSPDIDKTPSELIHEIF